METTTVVKRTDPRRSRKKIDWKFKFYENILQFSFFTEFSRKQTNNIFTRKKVFYPGQIFLRRGKGSKLEVKSRSQLNTILFCVLKKLFSCCACFSSLPLPLSLFVLVNDLRQKCDLQNNLIEHVQVQKFSLELQMFDSIRFMCFCAICFLSTM